MSSLALRWISPAATSDILAPSMATESPLSELENLLGPRLFGVNLGKPPPMFAGRFALLEIRGHGASSSRSPATSRRKRPPDWPLTDNGFSPTQPEAAVELIQRLIASKQPAGQIDAATAAAAAAAAK
ncbi:MAG TPA: hypothetical protein PKW35_24900 [Nannocystaceae bacterium]|nr:hypothetical protein [Nannocystaceae bacterium]